jgi:hypothetical protein
MVPGGNALRHPHLFNVEHTERGARGDCRAVLRKRLTMIVDALLAHPGGVANIAGRARAAGASDAEI